MEDLELELEVMRLVRTKKVKLNEIFETENYELYNGNLTQDEFDLIKKWSL